MADEEYDEEDFNEDGELKEDNEEGFNLDAYSEAQDIISSGLENALSEMESMVANEGQASVYDNYVQKEFEDQREQTKPGNEWGGIDIGAYMDFMGEIVEVGNNIMEDACDEAAERLKDIF